VIEIESKGRHSRYIKLANKLAHKSDFYPYKMAAVVVRGGRVIGTGVNRQKQGVLKHPAYALKAIHSELDAILGIDPDLLRGSTVYVSGVSKGNNLIKSAPCESCQQLMREYGIRAVVYHEKTGEVNTWRVC
jgi:deoxycytidylate deaminase